MKPAWVLLALLGCAASGAGGWYSATLPEPLPIKTTVAAISIPEVEHTGFQIALAFNQFVKLGLVAPSAASSDQPAAPPILEEPIEVIFRRQVSAIIGEGRLARLVVADVSGPTRRAYKVGDLYQDGWIVASLAPQQVTLRRGRELREIPLFGQIPNRPSAPSPTP